MTTPNQPGYDPDFMEDSGKSFSFDGAPPLSVTGIVQNDNPVKMQQRDFDDGELLTWPDGNPKWQWRVDLQTDLREAADDDGTRSVYLKFRSKAAVVAAVKQSGAKRLERGGKLTLTYTSNDHSQPHRTKPEYGCTAQCQTGKGFPAKNYSATYEAPSAIDWMAPDAPPGPGPVGRGERVPYAAACGVAGSGGCSSRPGAVHAALGPCPGRTAAVGCPGSPYPDPGRAACFHDTGG